MKPDIFMLMNYVFIRSDGLHVTVAVRLLLAIG